jgi:hypothetical protein
MQLNNIIKRSVLAGYGLLPRVWIVNKDFEYTCVLISLIAVFRILRLAFIYIPQKAESARK